MDLNGLKKRQVVFFFRNASMIWRKIEKILELMGSYQKMPLESEEPARQNARRSLIAKNDIQKGKTITLEDLTWKRPAQGICPSKINRLLGSMSNQSISEDTILQWEMFAKE